MASSWVSGLGGQTVLVTSGVSRHGDAPCLLVVASARAVRRSAGGLSFCSGQRDVGGAGAVAVDDGRQPLHVGAEDLGDGLLARFRTAPGTPRRHATPGSGADRSARRGSDRPPRRGGRDVAGVGSARRPSARRWLRYRRRRPSRPPRHRTESCRYAAGRSCGPPHRRRSRGVDASPRTPGRRSCGPAWRGPSRSAGTAWPADPVPRAATAPREPTRPRRRRSARRGAGAPRRRTGPAAHRSALP